MCVNIHKKELECDGIRNKTKFIPLKQFTDLDLLSGKRCASVDLVISVVQKITECVARELDPRYMFNFNPPDYRLLEEIGRTVETVKKNMEQKKMTSQNSLPVVSHRFPPFDTCLCTYV